MTYSIAICSTFYAAHGCCHPCFLTIFYSWDLLRNKDSNFPLSSRFLYLNLYFKLYFICSYKKSREFSLDILYITYFYETVGCIVKEILDHMGRTHSCGFFSYFHSGFSLSSRPFGDLHPCGALLLPDLK